MSQSGYNIIEITDLSIDKNIWKDVLKKFSKEFSLSVEELKLIFRWVYHFGECGGRDEEAMLEVPMCEVKKSIRRNKDKLALIPFWLSQRANNLWIEDPFETSQYLVKKKGKHTNVTAYEYYGKSLKSRINQIKKEK